ncbi:P-type conjugative transfer protein VirB9 [Wolbachia pipientis]|uniref:P-type conjugative transfer protein VirB9 n=1 Tax=Wolbachia pipientis TaxID=955 RepID=A0A1E7QJZ3_WOLPI|nr:P-type conjugative transfer protein VirB9 [Wolbachia pipientis]OEY86717.1 P-type conjugative transfer protein VirB9 [Wolbachia pipientis]
MNRLLCVMLLVLCCGTIFAKQEPRSISGDDHIKVISYNPHAIHKYTGFYGYQSSILFEPGEVIQSITMGDSTGWQLHPQGNRLFIKPIDDIADTNATIITDRRIYYFELHAEEATGLDDPRLAYEVRFLYPLFDDGLFMHGGDVFNKIHNTNTAIPDLSDIEVIKKGINFNYSISHIKGSESIVPIRAFDDGKFTYLQFRKNSEFPAVFVVNSHGYESLVNFRTEDDFLIVERVNSVFTLRHGSSTVCLFNENIPFKKSKRSR